MINVNNKDNNNNKNNNNIAAQHSCNLENALMHLKRRLEEIGYHDHEFTNNCLFVFFARLLAVDHCDKSTFKKMSLMIRLTVATYLLCLRLIQSLEYIFVY